MSRDFHLIKIAVNEKLKNMEETYKDLYVVNIDNQKLWEIYLESFPKEENPIFRERRVYDCNCCKHFFKNIGNVIAINENNEYVSIWDIDTGDEVFNKVVNALSEEVKKYPISKLFRTDLKTFGSEDNFDNYLKNVKWKHFMYKVPKKYRVDKELKSAFIGNTNTDRRLLFEFLKNTSIEVIQTVNELIEDNLLYKGSEYSFIVKKLIELKTIFDNTKENEQLNLSWKLFIGLPREVCKVKNTSIGVLLEDINKGEDIETAVKKYETVVAPENYKRSKPIYSRKMLDEAKKTIQDLGYLESIDRRYANIDDIPIEDTLFVNRDIKQTFNNGILSVLDTNVTENPKKYNNLKNITIDEFLSNILPKAKKIQALVENKHVKNLMTLTTSLNKNSKSLFKWDNPFAWSYRGGISDSKMKDEVMKKGGKVVGDFRFSIMWNDDKENLSDLDAHVKEKFDSKDRDNEIYFIHKKSLKTKGELDVDIINPNGIAVENIIYENKNNMLNGKYILFVDYYSKGKGYENGFKAEIEIDNEVYTYTFKGKPFYRNDYERVYLAEVTYKDGNFEIKHLLKNEVSTSSTKIWNINTNQFVDVKLITKSPNCWGDRNIGNEHLFFILDNCVSEETPKIFFNEYLKEELFRNHRKVFEALSQFSKIEETNNQLSGIGFSSTKRNDLVLKVDGIVIKLIF